jgi:hypothetical protein
MLLEMVLDVRRMRRSSDGTGLYCWGFCASWWESWTVYGYESFRAACWVVIERYGVWKWSRAQLPSLPQDEVEVDEAEIQPWGVISVSSGSEFVAIRSTYYEGDNLAATESRVIAKSDEIYPADQSGHLAVAIIP